MSESQQNLCLSLKIEKSVYKPKAKVFFNNLLTYSQYFINIMHLVIAHCIIYFIDSKLAQKSKIKNTIYKSFFGI